MQGARAETWNLMLQPWQRPLAHTTRTSAQKSNGEQFLSWVSSCTAEMAIGGSPGKDQTAFEKMKVGNRGSANNVDLAVLAS